MKYVSSRQFRECLSRFCHEAEQEEIIIDRPGGKLLRLSAISDADAEHLRRFLGEPEGFDKKDRK